MIIKISNPKQAYDNASEEEKLEMEKELIC
jgi:hypothetical protein